MASKSLFCLPRHLATVVLCHDCRLEALEGELRAILEHSWAEERLRRFRDVCWAAASKARRVAPVAPITGLEKAREILAEHRAAELLKPGVG